ncbi:unnamed protein product [Somion occarium]|uniref:F-box domain-containing protein n=1 Tax=Somion occarium TaxID=3059160 RepID=A0ABP1CT56_9APHY
MKEPVALNHDVLHSIMLQLSVQYRPEKALLPMMQTCKALHESGLPILLGIPIELSNANAEAFCRFVLSDKVKLGGFLRDLTLYDCGSAVVPEPQVFRIADDLTELFKYTPGIRKLRVKHTQNLWTWAKPLFLAIVALPNVEWLQLEKLSLESEAQLKTMTVSAKSLSLSFGWKLHPYDVDLASLIPFRSSLKDLCSTVVSFVHVNTQFAAMQTLAFDWLPPAFIDAPALARLFPNLRSLTVHQSETANVLYMEEDLSLMQQRNKERSGDMAWQQLDHLGGSPAALFTLGISCPVQHLEPEWDFEDHGMLDKLVHIVEDCGPRSIAFTAAPRDVETIQGMLALFQACIVHPDSVMFMLDLHDESVDILDPIIMDDFFKLLQVLRASHIEIHLIPRSDFSGPLTTSWCSAGIRRLHLFAYRILQSMNAVQHILIEIPGIEALRWEVVCSGVGGRENSLRGMSSFTARTLHFIPT